MTSELKEFYEERAGNYLPDDSNYNRIDKIRKIVDSVPLKQNLRVLEVGCGNGYILKKIQEKRNVEMYGFDLSEKKVEMAKKVGIIAKVHDATKKFPYEDNFFDVVVCSEVLEHLFFPEECIMNINRCLKKDGILIITTPNLAFLWSRFSLLLRGTTEYIDYEFEKEHIRFYTQMSLTNMVERCGLKVVNFMGAGFFIGIPFLKRYSKTVKNFNLALQDSFSTYLPSLSQSLVVICKK